jgi:hypothetical protein
MSEPALPAPIASAGEAQSAIANLEQIMVRLSETIEEETALLRAGKLHAAAGLEAGKTELSRAYVRVSGRLKAAQGLIADSLPDAVERLRAQHDAFRQMLRTNLTVLATAHAVSEGIIRGVSGELARKLSPSTYGATGRANTPGAKVSQPMAVSRSL